jgi:hypothetical protein
LLPSLPALPTFCHYCRTESLAPQCITFLTLGILTPSPKATFSCSQQVFALFGSYIYFFYRSVAVLGKLYCAFMRQLREDAFVDKTEVFATRFISTFHAGLSSHDQHLIVVFIIYYKDSMLYKHYNRSNMNNSNHYISCCKYLGFFYSSLSCIQE